MKKTNKIGDWIFIRALSKWQLKIFLLFVGLVIVLSAVYFTNIIVHELITREQESIKLYTKLYSKFSDVNSNTTEFDNLIFEIVPMITFPVIITDENDEPYEPYQSYSLNVEIDTSLSPAQQKAAIKELIAQMKNDYEPILLKDAGKIYLKFYYTHSGLISQLQLFPFIEIIVVAVFIIVGYLAFSNIRRSEESKVWVGMAKEAAHQLGTPLSSILAWIEIIRYRNKEPEAVTETLNEMENDIARLNMIATRFSKIGSQPELKPENLTESIESVCQYFEKRLPHLGRRVAIKREFKEQCVININGELFAWVIENLLKNAAESIESKDGKVEIRINSDNKKHIVITVTDNGKGMTGQQRRQAFLPGYTTKKRGWGLGLNLCRRIVEEYHKGKIYIKETSPGKGTTFAVEIPRK